MFIEARCNLGISKGASRSWDKLLFSKNKFLFSFAAYTIGKVQGQMWKGGKLTNQKAATC